MSELSVAAQAVESMVGMGKRAHLGDNPAGIVLLYQDGSYLQMLIGDYEGEERETLREALREAAEEL
jgi:hypothetical protein